MARKQTRKRSARRRPRAASSGKTTRCKYVSTHGSKRVADRMGRSLKRDGFRPLVTRGYGGAHMGYVVYSCGRLKKRR